MRLRLRARPSGLGKELPNLDRQRNAEFAFDQQVAVGELVCSLKTHEEIDLPRQPELVCLLNLCSLTTPSIGSSICGTLLHVQDGARGPFSAASRGDAASVHRAGDGVGRRDTDAG